MRSSGMRPLAAIVATGGLLAAATGCSTTMRDLPLPGTGVPGDTIEVTAQFDEALNLAEGAPVKVNGVDSGKVRSITVDDFTAEVTMTVRTDARLHQGATARLRYTTPLGELFVDVTNPPRGAALDDGAEIVETETAPTVEDALAQASLLINGGGLDQLQTITEELNTAVGGNEGDVRLLLQRAQTFLTEANATTSSIDAVLRSLNSLSGTLSEREALFNRAVREIRPAAAVLRRATPELTALLKAVERFSVAANDTIDATRSRLLALLGEFEPVLAELAANRGRFDEMLRKITAAAAAAREAVPGDYLSIGIDLHLDRIKAGNLPLLEDLLGVLGILAPVGEVVDQLGLDDVLDLLGRPAATADRGGARDRRSTAGTADTTRTTDPLSLDDLVGGLAGGGS